MHFGKLAPDPLFELGLYAVSVLQADVAGDLGDDVSVDALMAIAELNVDEPTHLGV